MPNHPFGLRKIAKKNTTAYVILKSQFDRQSKHSMCCSGRRPSGVWCWRGYSTSRTLQRTSVRPIDGSNTRSKRQDHGLHAYCTRPSLVNIDQIQQNCENISTYLFRAFYFTKILLCLYLRHQKFFDYTHFHSVIGKLLKKGMKLRKRLVAI